MPSSSTHLAQRALSRIGLAYFLYFVIAYGAQLLLVPLISLLPEEVTEAPLTVWLSSLVPMYLLALPVFFLTVLPIPEAVPARRRLRVRHFLLFFVVSYAVMYLTNLLGIAINLLTDSLFGSASSAGATELISESPLIYTLLFAVLLGPAVEELMFRRLILTRLRRFGDGFAILVSALIFALFHGNLAQFFYAFAVGLLLGWLYTSTGRLLHPILLHVSLNFAGSILPLLVTRAVDLEAIESLSAAEVIAPEAAAALLPSLLLLFAYFGALLLLVGAGLLLLPRLLRRARLAPARMPIPRGERRLLPLSVGGLLFLLATLGNLLLSYL